MNTELHTDSFPIAVCLQTLLTRAGFETDFARDPSASISEPRFIVTSSVSWEGMKQALSDAKKQFPISSTKAQFGLRHFATLEMLTSL